MQSGSLALARIAEAVANSTLATILARGRGIAFTAARISTAAVASITSNRCLDLHPAFH
jgi:hypothetical protein